MPIISNFFPETRRDHNYLTKQQRDSHVNQDVLYERTNHMFNFIK